ncbi:MAG: hypothetical protein DU429_08475 [Candidatus Tokpelaia sp.]|uniref:hypothetical protein n=1 Tax=Candidatus Tokpelaia sp. TaxID=2233777 RepID=UPI00123AC3CD|nr:hypothetical protein [Candidatus Tokpelaia sp.]KAA6205286.1 MAG: hypothetical protein DU429_08475 [Candidatus Tokpelaia sp.]KAA6206061.1 MAG: hypothetical protein DU430_02365 [Candidatus Tokpelaia sp.]KAA6405626.1 hypothetical protein DPQ22_03690 [Candidatus Tokpelaia sp.]
MRKHKIKFFQAEEGETPSIVEKKVNNWLGRLDMSKTEILSIRQSHSMATAMPTGIPLLVFVVTVHYTE